jgi:hypothetical protein
MAPINTDLNNTFFAYTLCAHHSANILSDRGYINTIDPNSLTFAKAGAMVWSQIVENEEEQLHFWETAAAEIKSALVSGEISLAAIAAAKGLPARQAKCEKWATRAAEALIAVTRAELLTSARAEVNAELRKKAELDELEVAVLEEAGRCEAPCGRYSPVSPIDPRDLAMVDWDGPEPSIGRPSSVLYVEVDEEKATVAAPYLDLDRLAPLVQVATAERLTSVKLRIVDC